MAYFCTNCCTNFKETHPEGEVCPACMSHKILEDVCPYCKDTPMKQDDHRAWYFCEKCKREIPRIVNITYWEGYFDCMQGD